MSKFKSMDIIFIGGFFPEQFTSLILSKSKLQVQNAANEFQWAFIKGLEQNLNRPIKLITAPFIGWYPKYYRDLTVRTSYFSDSNDLNAGVMVGFLNLPLIKNIFKFYNIYSFINNSFSSKGKNVLIVYSLNLVYLKAALKAKQKKCNSIVCVIITDLHEFPGDNGVFYKLYIKYVQKPIVYKLLTKVDCFVVVTNGIVDFLKLSHKPCIRIEGLYDDQTDYEYGNTSQDEINKIVFLILFKDKYIFEHIYDILCQPKIIKFVKNLKNLNGHNTKKQYYLIFKKKSLSIKIIFWHLPLILFSKIFQPIHVLI